MNAPIRSLLALAVTWALCASGTAFAQHEGHAAPKSGQQSQATNATEASRAKAADHSQMDHSQMDHSLPVNAKPREAIPAVSEADRQAAFPTVHDHHKHGTSIQNYWLADRLEFSGGDHGTEFGWEGMGWIGGDIQKLLLRSEGHALGGKVERGDIEVLYSRGLRAWWDLVAGVRHDFGEGPSRTWAAFGVQGMAPYKFEVSATAYVGQGGRIAARVEAEYDILFTNRLIMQWRAEAALHGKDDARLGIGAGLSTMEAGARLRYEVSRQFAPYVGIEHERAFGNTADFRRAAGADVSDTRIVAGVRIWF